ncbi:LysR substrate-binding domain-containing protein [Flavobacterium sp. DG1-102-2]|uniref:LysR substrate-binding domain-containing protein n=1 Tax=Flavobacterium sp. DG1-102-2 TaxID=3081663 RepID=UPI002948DD7F|nr:LysR substrate-binding domain-containing protein [Flavobacterium sp. DG1-102-2]MDV6168482.1 LysR substrate-binding domain-containing protein [Flavobacterium sp. DG1-102-2]
MELRQLKYFVKAAELNNFTEAALALHITQSTLSQQIKQLENELGILLFDRIAKRVRLTEAGSLFLPYAQRTAKDAEDGKNILKDLMDIRTGKLSIGVTYGLTNLLTKAIVSFSALYPDIKLEIGFGTTAELLQKLNEGKVDLMLSYHPVEESNLFSSEVLFTSSLALITHNDRYDAEKGISIKKLQHLPLILPSEGYSIRNYLDAAFTKHKVMPDIKMEVNDINTLLQLVNTGNWYTILMETTLFNYPDLKAIKITGEGMNRNATITWLADSYKTKAATVLSEYLKQHALL